MNRKYHISKREFLNKDPAMRAYAMAIVEDTRDVAQHNEDHWRWGEIELKFADCFDEVSFEFDLSTPQHRANSLHKARKIAEFINEFVRSIETEAADIDAREAVKPLYKALAVYVH